MNICVVKINKSSVTETFIQAHIDHIPGVTNVLYGSSKLLFDYNSDTPISGEHWLINRLLMKIKRIFFSSTYEQQLIQAQCNYFKKHRISLVIAEYGFSGFQVYKASSMVNIPLVVFFHGHDASDEVIGRENKKEFRELAKYASKLIGVSKSMCQRLINHGAPKKKVYHLPYGVNMELILSSQNKTAHPTFIHVGRMINMKAPYLTILAFEKVVKKHPESKLIFIGNTGLEEQNNEVFEVCSHIIRSLKLEGNVEILGNVPHDAVFNYLARSWVFVLHSITTLNSYTEGTPNAILEAMATGLPVISTKHEGIMDVVDHELDGFLVDEKDIDGMASHMNRCAANFDLVQRMGECAKNKIMKEYTYQKYIVKLQSIVLDER